MSRLFSVWFWYEDEEMGAEIVQPVGAASPRRQCRCVYLRPNRSLITGLGQVNDERPSRAACWPRTRVICCDDAIYPGAWTLQKLKMQMNNQRSQSPIH